MKLINPSLLYLLRWQGRLDKARASLHAGLAMAAEHQGCLELLAEVRDLQHHLARTTSSTFCSCTIVHVDRFDVVYQKKCDTGRVDASTRAYPYTNVHAVYCRCGLVGTN